MLVPVTPTRKAKKGEVAFVKQHRRVSYRMLKAGSDKILKTLDRRLHALLFHPLSWFPRGAASSFFSARYIV